ncbi:MAG: response regulator transcription factor [Bacillota bacterium]
MKRILIIEDEISIAELERDYLEISGYEVSVEICGGKGLEKAKRNDYDLIILDLMLPKLDGFEVCKQIRKESEIPILIVSARKEDIDKIRGLGLGADDFITKPFSPNELVARVKAHLMRYERLTGGRQQVNEVVQINGLCIDKSSRRVYLNEIEIVMTTKEFDLLMFLAENPDRVYSKEELFDKVWGFDAVGDIATVTVHIKKIREKLGQNNARLQFIETVWGAGYRFRK